MAKVKAKREVNKAKPYRFPWIKVVIVLTVLLGAWLIYLDAVIRDKFEGRRWQLPAQVYAQPMELYPGQTLALARFTSGLDQLGYARVSRVQAPGEFSVSGSGVDVHVRSFRFPEEAQKAGRYQLTFSGQTLTGIRQNQSEVDWLRLDPMRIAGIYPNSGEDRVLVSLQDVPKTLTDTLIAVEDRGFYTHWGVSPLAIARAFWVNIRSGSVVQGGSTLTQQLVKNFFLSDQQTLGRKLNEAFMSLLLEVHYAKEEILETYLNEVFLAQAGRRAIHGFEQGSLHFFGKSVSDLTADQIALLVGMVKGPSFYEPRRNPERAMSRRNLVLDVMADQGILKDDDASALKKRSLGVVKVGQSSANRYPGFLALVRKQLAEDYSADVLRSDGLKIFTTLDPMVQDSAEEAMVQTTASLAKSSPKNNELQGAMIVTSHANGEVVAMISDRNPRFSGFNRALEAKRQIGSLIKPVIAVTALQSGKATLASRLNDTSFKLLFDNGKEWQPANYDGLEHGQVLLNSALAHSYNLAFARLGIDLGVADVLSTLGYLGVDDLPEAYPATMLGAVNLTPLQVTQVYQNLLGGGFAVPIRTIRAVSRADGSQVARYPYRTQQVLSPEVAYLLQHALVSVAREGTARSIYSRFSSDVVLGGKTGTTNDNRDSWFVGFDGRFLVTTWLGRDDNGVTSLTGSSGALKVWADVLARVGPESWQPVKPESVEWAYVEEETGNLSREGCPGVFALPFIAGTEPQDKSGCLSVDSGIEAIRSWWQGVFE